MTLPIDPTEPMATQSRHALMLANDAGLLTYRAPVDTRKEEQVEALRAEFGTDVELPDNPGVYYLVFVTSGPGEQLQPVLIPEGEARSFVLALAVKAGPDAARRVQYMRGLLPR